MNVKKIFDDALYSTYVKFAQLDGGFNEGKGFNQIQRAMKEYIGKGNPGCISNVNEGRNNVLKYVEREEIARYMAEYFIRMTRVREPKNLEEMKAVLFVLGTDSSTAVKQIRNCLLGKNSKIGDLSAETISEMVYLMYFENQIKQMYNRNQDVARRAQEAAKKEYGVKNLQINRNLVNYCREEVLNGRQIQIQNEIRKKYTNRRPRREYNLNDEMVAVTDIGQKRSSQQDSIVMLYHPQNPKYKLLVVADGMGGTVDGDKASQEITKQMVEWFESLSPNMLLDINGERLKYEWRRKLNEIHKTILDKNPSSGSTFVGAIVGEKTTTIASVGDSRCYALDKRGNLCQMTVDDNMDFLKFHRDWEEKERRSTGVLHRRDVRLKRQQKEDLRFRRGSNMITKCLGASNFESEIIPAFNTLKNDSYKSLMLFSDGVTDCLSDDQLLAITRNTASRDLARAIVNSALTNESVVREELKNNPNYYSRISGGKDNASAVVYNNKEGEER